MVGGAVNRRIVDLLLPFADSIMYDPDQCGKAASMKQVLPALTGRDYERWRFRKAARPAAIFGVMYGKVSEAERKRVRRALDQYCGTGHGGNGLDSGCFAATKF